jgi:serine/threonine protein kinase
MHEQLGPYVILGKLAAGGMATVYVAKHARLENAVGLKVLHPHYQADEKLRIRFVDEAKIQANLRHPNILQVQDILELPDASAMVMELLSGCALDTYYAKVGRPLPLPLLLGLFLPLLDALSHAHDQGVVHRDLKPSNIFLHCQKDVVIPKLMDFGIAKLQRQALESQVTAAGAMLGTPQYMAPEQFEDSSKVDARADQFAIGVMLYEATVGALPFAGENVAEIMKGILTKTPVPPHVIHEGFPEALETIILRCLEKGREARYDSVQQLRDALAAVGDEVGSEQIQVAQVPLIDLRDRGIDITTPITSSRMITQLESSTNSERPDNEREETAPDSSAGTQAWDSQVDTTGGDRPPKKGRKWGLWLTLAILAVVAVGAFVVFGGKKGSKKVGKKSQAVEAKESAVAKKTPDPVPSRNEEEVAPPLAELPHREGLQLGSWCNPNATSLVEKMVNARLMGGWRGERLSRLAERQLNQLGVTGEEQENFRVIRGQNTLVREVDRLAIAASVKPFKASPLTDADLDSLASKLERSSELKRYLVAKVDYLCRSLPLSASGDPEEVGRLYNEVLEDHGFEPMEFTPLDSSYADERLIQAEYSSRAVCCLLKSAALAQ